ncbi:TGF-beta-activated kinase 1 and MAP3K7-binding protein 1 [Eumeta japonica]|uniref:TGF-beta-activated kinase 1 and MAP3K7-binding protein 1 n=1 Tax=Eumeta variegata TaxID=151549 RepID=A0A4C1XWN9_EUMVA|nr:TGF-beta-activated kinase 1 and MAP3K7-binding protein 1 [Eumeta japonica]
MLDLMISLVCVLGSVGDGLFGVAFLLFFFSDGAFGISILPPYLHIIQQQLSDESSNKKADEDELNPDIGQPQQYFQAELNYLISKESDTILARLKEIDQHLSGGSTVILALVHNNKLYVANVGEARALLCRTDDNYVLRVVQLSVDHSLNNEDELLRLSQLGLDVDRLRNGNYLVKGLYKAFPDIRAATAEPVIPTPEIHGPIVLDDSCRFLVLVSSGVYKRIQEVKGSSEQANKQLSQIIVENFRKATNFETLCQSVLDEIEQEFMSYCMKNNLTPKSNTHMTLLIRNFNFPLPNCPDRPETYQNVQRNDNVKQNAVRFNPIVQSKSNTFLENSEIFTNSSREQILLTNDSYADTNVSTSSMSSDIYPTGRLPYDKNERIKGYVDFSCYYENVEKARKNGTLPSFIK